MATEQIRFWQRDDKSATVQAATQPEPEHADRWVEIYLAPAAEPATVDRDSPTAALREALTAAESLTPDDAGYHLTEAVEAYLDSSEPAAIQRVRDVVTSYGHQGHSAGCGFEDCSACVVEEFAAAIEGREANR